VIGTRVRCLADGATGTVLRVGEHGMILVRMAVMSEGKRWCHRDDVQVED